jgi:hypothetical protein
MTSHLQMPSTGLRERKKARTRRLIADTAARLFVERGYEQVNFQTSHGDLLFLTEPSQRYGKGSLTEPSQRYGKGILGNSGTVHCADGWSPPGGMAPPESGRGARLATTAS